MKYEGLIASIRQRLMNLSRENGEAFDFVLTRYGVERFLYRLSVSGHADQFVLKGSMLPSNAIRATFKRRGSDLPAGVHTGLTEEFARDKQVMWSAFLKKNSLVADDLSKVVGQIRSCLEWIWKE